MNKTTMLTAIAVLAEAALVASMLTTSAAYAKGDSQVDHVSKGKWSASFV